MLSTYIKAPETSHFDSCDKCRIGSCFVGIMYRMWRDESNRWPWTAILTLQLSPNGNRSLYPIIRTELPISYFQSEGDIPRNLVGCSICDPRLRLSSPTILWYPVVVRCSARGSFTSKIRIQCGTIKSGSYPFFVKPFSSHKRSVTVSTNVWKSRRALACLSCRHYT